MENLVIFTIIFTIKILNLYLKLSGFSLFNINVKISKQSEKFKEGI